MPPFLSCQISFDNGRCSWEVPDLKRLKPFEISELKGITRMLWRSRYLDEF